MKCSMTAVCGACGEVFWAKDRHVCSKRRRSCAGLPRRRATAAEIAALDRRLLEVGQVAAEATARADDLEPQALAIRRALADSRRLVGLPPIAGLAPAPFRLIPGGAA